MFCEGCYHCSSHRLGQGLHSHFYLASGPGITSTEPTIVTSCGPSLSLLRGGGELPLMPPSGQPYHVSFPGSFDPIPNAPTLIWLAGLLSCSPYSYVTHSHTFSRVSLGGIALRAPASPTHLSPLYLPRHQRQHCNSVTAAACVQLHFGAHFHFLLPLFKVN